MKTLKLILSVALIAALALTMNSCKKCKGEDPRARIVNNGTAKADVQVKTSGGNTVNINNIQPGTSSDYASYAEGDVTFTANVGSTQVVKTVNVSECHDYDIVINSNNEITVKDVDRND